jgi:L-malate glycosyltransferase
MAGKASARILHIHGTLAAEAPLAERCVKVIAGLGATPRHTLLSADGVWSALNAVTGGLSITRGPALPRLSGLPSPGRLQRVAQMMTDYHLVLTYGRVGAYAALAHTLFAQLYALPPLLHHEDGSDESSAERRGWRSRWLRRVGLGRSAGLVVPSEPMEAVALVDWQQPLGRVKLIRDGVDLDRFAKAPRPDALPRVLKRGGERWIGCFAQGCGNAALAKLLSGFGALDANWHLVLVGGGVGTGEVERLIWSQGLEHRVHLIDALPNRAAALGLFDVLALVGGSDPQPLHLIEAMAAGRAVALIDASDAVVALSEDNAAPGNTELHRLATDEFLRRKIGAANREKAVSAYGEKAMAAAYRRLYASAMGRGEGL